MMKRSAKERHDAIDEKSHDLNMFICLNLSSVYNHLPVQQQRRCVILIVNTAQFNSPTKVLLNSTSIYGRMHETPQCPHNVLSGMYGVRS